MKTLITISMLALVFGTLNAQADIPVISLDDQGNETVTMLAEEDYQKVTIAQAHTFVQTADDQLAVAETMSPHLKLNGIMVGLEAAGTLGAVFKVGTAINQQFFFELKK